MNKAKNRPQYFILNISGLIFIYVILCILTVLFSRSFFYEILYEGKIPGRLNLVVFFTIPAALLVFLGIAAVNMLGDIIARRPGIKFKARLFGYFIIVVVFAAAPMTIVTGISISELLRFWRSINAEAASTASNSFAVDNYSFHIEHFEDLIRKTNWDKITSLPQDIASVQDFRLTGGVWTSLSFTGDEKAMLDAPPSHTEGFVMRELPRDIGFIRYVSSPAQNTVRLISYNIGEGFDLT